MPTDPRPVVLSMEQALSMSYATLRLVHQGYRVIRLEPTPVKGRPSKGDPNRYIGRPVAGEDRHSYYVAPNAGKEAIALNLKEPAGRELLHRLIAELPVDVFCTNTLPAHHPGLGVDYDSLRAVREDLIWCSISAMGTAHPKVPGYDPVLQALCGYMDLTGHADGPPLQCGPPIIDLKAGDEAFVQVILALAEHAKNGKGKRIDISMAQVAVSWLHTFLPMLDMGSPPEELKRNGNEHRQFIPVNAYRTADGFIYLAIGSDGQFARWTAQPMFAPLAQERFASNEGRRAHKADLTTEIEAITTGHSSAAISEVLAGAGIPHAPITPIEQVPELPFVAATALRCTAPDGREIRLPPPAVTTPHLEAIGGKLPFAPRYGEQTDGLLGEVGLDADELAELHDKGVVAGP
ncbi:MAG: CoA transferase [Deltaproteobacteria bacterium]|nr:CoA transferase [Deltaproteobacteria bacterium]